MVWIKHQIIVVVSMDELNDYMPSMLIYIDRPGSLPLPLHMPQLELLA